MHHRRLGIFEGFHCWSVDICTDVAYESVRSTATGHIIEALQNGTLKYRRYNEPAANKELLAYPVARMIVSSINNTYLTKRYALAVAKLAYCLLYTSDA